MSGAKRASRALALAALAGVVLALAGCGGAEQEDDALPYVIAGGSTTGVYYGYGEQLAAVLTRDLDVPVVIAETNGSVDNLLRIGSGEAVVGFAQSDAASDAVRGVGAFAEPLPIQAVARLYDEYVHVVVRVDSDIERIADLEGRVVSLGSRNSGVNVVATRILDAAGVDAEALENRELGLEASIEALERADIEAFFWVGGVPTPGLEDLTDRLPVRLLSVDADAVEGINSRFAGVYRFAEFPTGAYGGEEPTVTLAVPNYLVTSEAASDEFIHAVLASLFDARVHLAQHVPAAALLDRRSAIFTDSIDLHPGAISYYRQARG